MSTFFNLSAYCESFGPNANEWTHLDEKSRQFLSTLQLSSIHPFCDSASEPFPPDVPEMGPLLVNDHHETRLDAVITLWHQLSPALLAMSELWLRLFASVLAPLCIACLLWDLLSSVDNNKTKHIFWIGIVSTLSVASSAVLTTDMLYVLEFGPHYGASLLLFSSLLAVLSCKRYKLKLSMTFIFLLWVLVIYHVYDLSTGTVQFGGPEVPRVVEEGLYFDSSNPLMARVAAEWPVTSRTYTVGTGATPWMPTGDSRTGLPFLLHSVSSPTWTRVWVPTTDGEVVALDFSFPSTGHDSTKPLYMVLHGLNGGSKEDYVMDFANRRNDEKSTVVVMVARGLMDLPVKGWNVFHGARVKDADVAAKAIRKGLGPNQVLAGVGYSMGAVVISNYVARSGTDCHLDVAFAISGGIDMRHQFYYERAKRLWQPMLAKELRDVFVVGKFGERYRQRLSKEQMLELMRATHISGIDEHAVVTYNGFDDLMHYYSEMSARGDVPMDDNEAVSRISNTSIPFCVLHALDDPLITWKTVAADSGPMYPPNLVKTGAGYLMILLTKRGGHVGWPLGLNARANKWQWMNDAAKHFVDAVVRAKESMQH
jgi:predicted alpha/beta-fold hydrolase